MVKEVATTLLPTEFGIFQTTVFQEENGREHLALTLGNLRDNPPGDRPLLTRVHSQCLTGETFLSLKCDCRWQLHAALKQISKIGSGCLIYLQEEGRGIGLTNKIKAYKLQEKGLDTVEANHALGLKADYRDYRVAAAILRHFGVSRIRLLTNNPDKIARLGRLGISVTEQIPLETEPNQVNRQYLQTKKEALGHLFSLF
ncbi:GTP cyclohydrolase II [Patescibacteria group bacterium]|nr:GTP cyclohydrolase II [Patescibacteria group bacterium]